MKAFQIYSKCVKNPVWPVCDCCHHCCQDLT